MFVVTLNTWKCDGDYLERMSRLVSQLPSINPDVLLLQEVFAATEVGLDTAERVSDCLPQHQLVLAPARQKVRQFSGQEVMSTSGLALLVRGGVLNSRVLQLPHTPADGDRIAQIVKVEIAGVSFQVVNLHLTHIHLETELRKQQLEAIFSVLEPGPTILGGDFNDVIANPALRYLDSRVDRIAQSSAPTHRDWVIDYIAWRGFEYSGFEVSLLFDGVHSPRVSDHAGVGVRFEHLVS